MNENLENSQQVNVDTQTAENASAQPQTKQVFENKKTFKRPEVKITFLGGVGEIGKNMTCFETENEMIVVDAGLTFPDSDLPGIDLVVPDISYLIENKRKIKAIIITHGHEDHIGALPYVLNDIQAPVYGSKLTLGLIDNKMSEFKRIKYKTIEVKPKNVLKIGGFTIEFIKVTHSIAGALALCITTPAGNIVHTGDFKIDFEPIDGVITDLTRFGELGKKGVQLLMCESTNVCRPGYSLSEAKVGKVLEEVVFEKYKDRRLIISTFASNIHRLQQIMDLAKKYGRKIAFTGRSMINVSEVASKCGELSYDKSIIVNIEKVPNLADGEILICSTGSQGEPNSALTRMANDDFAKFKLQENDVVVLSSSPIPGNEKSVYNVINKLYKKNVEVIFDEMAQVHASGHACQEEIKTIHALTKPKFFIPVHGEYRHMKVHKDLAVSMGVPERNVCIAEIGSQLLLTPNNLKRIGMVKAGMRLVDGTGIGNLDSSVVRDRQQLSEDGFCVAVINIETSTSELKTTPIIITRGVVYDEEANELVKELKSALYGFLRNYDFKNNDQNSARNDIRKFILNFIFKKTKRKPLTHALVMFN